MPTMDEYAAKFADDKAELQRRIDVADEMLADAIAQIGTAPVLASLRYSLVDIKRELRGLPSARSQRSSTSP